MTYSHFIAENRWPYYLSTPSPQQVFQWRYATCSVTNYGP